MNGTCAMLASSWVRGVVKFVMKSSRFALRTSRKMLCSEWNARKMMEWSGSSPMKAGVRNAVEQCVAS